MQQTEFIITTAIRALVKDSTQHHDKTDEGDWNVNKLISKASSMT